MPSTPSVKRLFEGSVWLLPLKGTETEPLPPIAERVVERVVRNLRVRELR